MRSLDIAGTGLLAQQTNVEVISNNIANMTTTGFKRRRAEFQDLIYQNLRRVGSQSSDTGSILPSGAQIGLGVKTGAIYRIGEQGSLSQTENKFDLAIRGNGFFPVQLPSGETRRFLEDGDEVILRARARRDGCAPIGFGECRGTILPALPTPAA